MLAPDTDPATLAGLEIVDRAGERIGRVRQVYPDGGGLGWAGVRGNLIGTSEALVPLADAELEDDVLTLPITRARFLSAPRRAPDAPMDDDERALLRDHYADDPDPEPEPAAVRAPIAGPARAVTGADHPSPEPAPVGAATPADGPEGIDRFEQRLAVATEPVPRTRVVLRKVVVTEQRTITVPVRREEIRLVREPIEGAAPVAGTVLQEAEQEFVLHEERVVVTTEVVPVERIRLVREVLAEPQQVTGEVWREQLVTGEEPADR